MVLVARSARSASARAWPWLNSAYRVVLACVLCGALGACGGIWRTGEDRPMEKAVSGFLVIPLGPHAKPTAMFLVCSPDGLLQGSRDLQGNSFLLGDLQGMSGNRGVVLAAPWPSRTRRMPEARPMRAPSGRSWSANRHSWT